MVKIFWDYGLKAVTMVEDEGKEGDEQRQVELLGMGVATGEEEKGAR